MQWIQEWVDTWDTNTTLRKIAKRKTMVIVDIMDHWKRNLLNSNLFKKSRESFAKCHEMSDLFSSCCSEASICRNPPVFQPDNKQAQTLNPTWIICEYNNLWVVGYPKDEMTYIDIHDRTCIDELSRDRIICTGCDSCWQLCGPLYWWVYALDIHNQSKSKVGTIVKIFPDRLEITNNFSILTYSEIFHVG